MAVDRMNPNNYGPGRVGDHITWLGQRLVLHGYGSHYKSGPGPRWGEADRLNVRDFQLAQGWTGADADGLPGKTTLKILSQDPPNSNKTGLVSNMVDSRLTESSGLALSKTTPDLVWTMNDEPGSPQIFGVRVSTGLTTSALDLRGAGVFKDTEAISINAHGEICLADIGDNKKNRSDAGIAICRDPGIGWHGTLDAVRYPVSYQDGPRDAEALLIHPVTNRFFIISKEKKSRLYGFGDLVAGQRNTGRYLGVEFPAYVTDATFSVDGHWVFVRAKDKALIYVYEYATWKRVEELVCPKVAQGESITAEKSGKSVLIGSEGKKSPIYRVALPSRFWPGGSVPTPQKLPSEILNLQNWKLTLPEGEAGHPTEIKQPQLNTFVDPEHFFVRNNGVVFRAEVEGVTTSGSKYPRTELREMSGSKLAYWPSKSGTHVMTITQAITETPEKKPHVVAGQIHDTVDDVVMIRLEGTRMFVESRGKEMGDLTKNYVLGTEFTVTITADRSGISVSYNNATPVHIPGTFEDCYFKSGVYTQSNLSKGDKPGECGEVVVYNLTVVHS